MQRPTSVFVLGILNIVFGAFGLCSVAGMIIYATIMSSMMSKIPGMQQDPLMKQMTSGSYVTYLWIVTPVQFIFTVVLIAAGIGLIKMRPWARTASLVYAVYALLMAFVNLAATWIWVYAPILNMNIRPEQKMGVYAGSVGVVFALIYPCCLIFFLTRPHVVAAFAGTDEPPTGDIGRYAPLPQDANNPYRSPR